MEDGSRSALMPIRGANPDRPPPAGVELPGLVDTGAIAPVVERDELGSRLLLFSGPDAVRRWREVARFIGGPMNDMVALAPRIGATEVVLDIAGPVRRRITPEGEPIEPAPRPFDITALAAPIPRPAFFELQKLLAARPSVEAAWAVEATIDGALVLLLGVDPAPAEPDPAGALKALAAELLPLLPARLYNGVQFVVLEHPDVMTAVKDADAPIFVRS